MHPKIKKKLIKEYKEAGITRCEVCGDSFWLSFHHVNRRSSGKSKDTFDGTRLLCASCHHRVDNAPGYVEFNKELKKMR